MIANPDNILSPLTNKPNVVFEKKVSAQELERAYKEQYSFDVQYIFRGAHEVTVYKCTDTGYRFYYPFHLAGDDRFYKHFSQYPWYYLPWKWEHEECSKLVKDGDRILEVGAARGSFLSRLKKRKKVECVGLELNSSAVEESKEKGICVLNESIEDHALKMPEKYDVVCCFQVLEHIADVNNVIESMVACLKKGGTLVISVPNNDGFIRDNPLPSRILNMPPHHMGLWNESSLKNLCKVFPLIYLKTVFEPLQPAHLDTYHFIVVKKVLFNSNILVKAYWKLRIYLLARPFLRLLSKIIKGHSVLSVFNKSL